MCKARKALEAARDCFGIVSWIVYARDNPKSTRREAQVALEIDAALLPDDCVPREVAVRAREALGRLCDKLDVIAKSTVGIFAIALVHGARYKGPTYEQELKDARVALATLDKALKGDA